VFFSEHSVERLEAFTAIQ